ncbi:lasso peptide biosynthesis PqqD family chaperone [Thermomonospora umbrina]|uniref:Coenzyme PQQ synthesis protein D (PqqD) n=1 Tax=Thermomonospora umbrina TaxID=111806 RepID=A0A3D9SS11_9ACTN|nr:lasso peptide biosynthesis PqqD family chaperone [Thermomonospora umbrina]REE96753.1 coenzyme PQQ synthesis protein D (PqqD) [Thermomonospora umbrina]
MSLRFRAEVAATDTEYGTVLLDQRNGDYWQLNPTGALVVRRLLAGETPEQAAAALAEEFDVGRARALADVDALVEQLRTARLVTS